MPVFARQAGRQAGQNPKAKVTKAHCHPMRACPEGNATGFSGASSLGSRLGAAALGSTQGCHHRHCRRKESQPASPTGARPRKGSISLQTVPLEQAWPQTDSGPRAWEEGLLLCPERGGGQARGPHSQRLVRLHVRPQAHPQGPAALAHPLRVPLHHVEVHGERRGGQLLHRPSCPHLPGETHGVRPREGLKVAPPPPPEARRTFAPAVPRTVEREGLGVSTVGGCHPAVTGHSQPMPWSSRPLGITGREGAAFTPCLQVPRGLWLALDWRCRKPDLAGSSPAAQGMLACLYSRLPAPGHQRLGSGSKRGHLPACLARELPEALAWLLWDAACWAGWICFAKPRICGPRPGNSHALKPKTSVLKLTWES